MTINAFKAGAVHAGLKKNNQLDLGLIVSDRPARVAGVFTRNQVKAAPVQLDLVRIQSGRAGAVIANSGNANCMTGAKGMQDALAMTAAAAEALGLSPQEVLAASTGVIGVPLPIDRVTDAVPALVRALRPDGFMDFARAIMTTDTVPKIVQHSGILDHRPFQVLGMAKGAGMIAPHMATMLCFVCTDVDAPPALLKTLLTRSVDRSLNRIVIDGDASTNDSVILMANGAAGTTLNTPEKAAVFQPVLDSVLAELARDLVADGEGVTKLVEIHVRRAPSSDAADRIARTVATSPLVKTALFGEDANWGRIAAAAGRAGVAFASETMDIYFDDVQMVAKGLACGPEAESRATDVMRKKAFSIIIDLHRGDGEAMVLSCDFSRAYVDINADYRS